MKIIFSYLLLCFSCQNIVMAQIENVIVENYYVSDSADATNTIGGQLPIGSKTYRIFVVLKPGSKIKKIYGDVNHALKISSTAPFFNHAEDGQSFAKDFSKSRYSNNTVGLDTWITIGQTTKSSSKTYFGILKELDRDNSFIGGFNNDGGSASIRNGLLKNTSNALGIPLFVADGMDTMSNVPTSWANYGFEDISTGEDTTIFGSNPSHSFLISNNIGLQNSGVAGVLPNNNHVLIAQLTTLGDISFELNLEVEQIDGINKKVVKYVANNQVLLNDEIFSPFLKYPQVCGCKDPNYLEAQTNYACESKDSCKTLIVFGCMDTLACNYNANANFNISTLCCYVGYCNDLDLKVVCPNLKIRDQSEDLIQCDLFPNPAQDQMVIQLISTIHDNTFFVIYDSYGKMVNKKNQIVTSRSIIDVRNFENGLYFIRIFSDKGYVEKKFVKI